MTFFFEMSKKGINFEYKYWFSDMDFNQNDLELFAAKGIGVESVEEQLEHIAKGFPYLELDSAASVGNGIMQVSDSNVEMYTKAWDNYLKSGHSITKFVPASGAASRMFKDLFAFMDGDSDVPASAFEKKFFDGIRSFAFYSDLDKCCRDALGKGVDELVALGQYKTVVSYLLKDFGLNYGKLPKGLLKFHAYKSGARTPMEEHMAEGALYATEANAIVNLHFTVSPEHRTLFEQLGKECSQSMTKRYGTSYNISFSEQKPSTDTIAADADNRPFRNPDGSILFRPGGHGSLIENLNELDTDIVFIKNIDNVVPDHLKEPTVSSKKMLAGILVTIQNKIFEYLHLLDSGKFTEKQLKSICDFVQNTLYCRKDTGNLSQDELSAWLYKKLNRPVRVCGMVKNVGEPGGGPFLAYNPDGSISLQILESSQIDMNDERKKDMFASGTHFNPVDLVCALKDYKGQRFNLPSFVDRSTGFISSKSKDGKELKALELPGLWNGAMSDWNTLFVEVPIETFNPVKTVNDLLRPQHQPA